MTDDDTRARRAIAYGLMDVLVDLLAERGGDIQRRYRPTPRHREKQDTGPAVLEWTAATRVNRTVVPGVVWSIIPRDEEEVSEIERAIVEERVENPEDPAQYVDVERVEEIAFRDTVTGRRRRYRLSDKDRSP